MGVGVAPEFPAAPIPAGCPFSSRCPPQSSASLESWALAHFQQGIRTSSPEASKLLKI